MPPYWLATFASTTNSAVSAKGAGTYYNDGEKQRARLLHCVGAARRCRRTGWQLSRARPTQQCRRNARARIATTSKRRARLRASPAQRELSSVAVQLVSAADRRNR